MVLSLSVALHVWMVLSLSVVLHVGMVLSLSVALHVAMVLSLSVALHVGMVLSLSACTACNNSPSYLRNRLSHYEPTRTLRSSDANLLSIPSTVNQLTDCSKAFHCSAPAVWNSLNFSTRSAPSLDLFKERLKTELFNTAANVFK